MSLAERVRMLVPNTGLVGCSADEVAEVERQWGGRLPAVYRELLLLMGTDSSGITGAWYFGHEMVQGLNQELRQAIAHPMTHGAVFRTSVFAVGIREGCDIVFVETDGGDDPRVFQYGPEHEVFLVSDRLSDLIVEQVSFYGVTAEWLRQNRDTTEEGDEAAT